MELLVTLERGVVFLIKLFEMQAIIIFFFSISFVIICFVAFILLKNLPNNKERLKVVVPILIAFVIGLICYLSGRYPPSTRFGRFF